MRYAHVLSIAVSALLDDVPRLLRQSESDRLEFKADARDPRQVARNLAAFANARGGLLVIGVDERDGDLSVRGTDVGRAAAIVERAAATIKPTLDYRTRVVPYGDVKLYAVEVPEQDGQPFDVNGQVYLRRGVLSAPATADEIKRQILRRDETPAQLLNQLEAFAEALGRQGTLIERLERSSSWPRQLFWTLFGALLGTALGVLATLLIGGG